MLLRSSTVSIANTVLVLTTDKHCIVASSLNIDPIIVDVDVLVILLAVFIILLVLRVVRVAPCS